MKPDIGRFGYCRVPLSRNNKAVAFLVHRLVADSFIPNPNNFSIVNHLDGNKSNNTVENLEWCTVQQNAIHARDNGLTAIRDRHPRAILTSEKVSIIRNSSERATVLARRFGVKPVTISAIRHNRIWKTK